MTQGDLLKTLKEMGAVDPLTGVSVLELMLETGKGKASIYNCLKRLKKGKLIQSENGIYWVT